MDKDTLDRILEDHKKWLNNSGDGKRANFHGADLERIDLHGADLSGADLARSNLTHADLFGVNLYVADLYKADLAYSRLFFANLNGADLRNADLTYCNLTRADLRCANLCNANLSYANLYNADLRGADLQNAKGLPPIVCPEEGSFIAWKKGKDMALIKLLIPEDAARCSATTRKCRASKAKVLAITKLNGEAFGRLEAYSDFDRSFTYKVGETVEVLDFDTNRWNECSTGIHFFMSRQEAIDYQ